MPFNASGVYTPASGATTAVPGGLIQSAVWNAIFGDLSSALTLLGEQLYGSTAVAVGASPYTPLAADTLLLCASSGGAISILLPAAASRSGYALRVKDSTGNAQTNNVTITPNGAETIEGLASIKINMAYGGFWLIPVSSGWIISP